jgi:hypothetical protein
MIFKRVLVCRRRVQAENADLWRPVSEESEDAPDDDDPHSGG